MADKIAGAKAVDADTAPRVACASRCRPLPTPLYVIDGVIVGRATPATLDRAMIDTIIILRGAEAARRYGGAARDGAVEITMIQPDSAGIASLPPETPLSTRQAVAVCGRPSTPVALTVIDGRALTGGSEESAWPSLTWSEVVRRDYYTPDEAMAEFGKAGRFGALLYTSRYAATADSSIRRRPPTNRNRIIIRALQAPAAKDTEPLFVINGTPVAPGDSTVGDLNPDDIADIEIVRCPLAVVRYGMRAARGAVLITLKPGIAFPRARARP